MIATKSLPCYACRPGLDISDLQRVLAQGDVGLTIYRFRAPERNRPGRVSKETIIFYTTRNIQPEGHREMNIEILEAGLPKCINYCPRCKMMMQRIESLFQGSPPTDRPTDLRELFSCPPCTDIVHKFKKFVAFSIKEQDSEIIHLQRLTSPQYSADVNTRSTRSTLDQAGKTDFLKMSGTLKDSEEDSGMKKEDGKDKKVGTTETKREAKKEKEGISKDSKSIVASTAGSSKDLEAMKKRNRKIKENINKDGEIETGVAETTKDLDGMKKGKAGEGKSSVTKVSSKIKKDDKTIKDGNSRKSLNKGKGKSSPSQTWKNLPKEEHERVSSYNTESPTIREKIMDHMRKTLERNLKDQHIKEATTVARAAAEAARQEKFKEKLQLLKVPPITDVESSILTDECPQDLEECEFIRGNRIYKMKEELADQELGHQDRLVEPATARRVKFTRPPTPGPPADEKSSAQSSSPSRRDGVLYKLSDRKYLSNAWTQLPKEIVVRKMAIFQMRPTRVPFDWFEKNKSKSRVFYQSGQELATLDENGTRFYYLSGQLAMEYYNTEDPSAGGKRVVVYSTGKQEGRARPRTVLAVFDYVGNGVVYNHAGQPRLKYNQNEGVVFDQTIRPHTQWKWHNLNASPLLYTVLLEDELPIKDPVILKQCMKDTESMSKSMSNENVMKAIEAQNMIKEKTLVNKYVPFLVEMKTFKINEHFSLRIRKQSQIYLNFSDGRNTLKINVGLILDPKVVVNEEFIEVGVVNDMEKIPECSESVERLRVLVRRARSVERSRVLRERKLNHTPSYIFQKHQKL